MIVPLKRLPCKDSSSLNPILVFFREAPTMAIVRGQKNGFRDSTLSSRERITIKLLLNGDSRLIPPSDKPLGLEEQDGS